MFFEEVSRPFRASIASLTTNNLAESTDVLIGRGQKYSGLGRVCRQLHQLLKL
jgi:hypothetical protein